MRKHWPGIVLLLTLFVVLPVAAEIYQRAACTTITAPETGKTVCYDTTAQVWKVWTGTAWNDALTITGTVGAGHFRTDAGVEVQGPNGLLNVANTTTPANATSEAAYTLSAYDSAGNKKKMMSLSAMWVSTDANTGYAKTRFNSVYNGGAADDVWMTGYGHRGVRMFSDAADGPGQDTFVVHGTLDAGVGFKERSRSAYLGEWTIATYDAADFGTTGGGTTWTVENADRLSHQFTLVGKTMFLNVTLGTTTIASAPTSLDLRLPAGYVAVKPVYFPYILTNNGGAYGTGLGTIGANSATINLYSTATGAPWVAGADNNFVSFAIPLEVTTP